MGVDGIGARVKRKEDRRFITGKGKYTDDMTVPGMGFAAFVRSPHAHAKVKSIDASAALDMPGVEAVLTGEQLVGDGVGNLICGWMIHSTMNSAIMARVKSAKATFQAPPCSSPWPFLLRRLMMISRSPALPLSRLFMPRPFLPRTG